MTWTNHMLSLTLILLAVICVFTAIYGNAKWKAATLAWFMVP